jgi:hypothetical protein
VLFGLLLSITAPAMAIDEPAFKLIDKAGRVDIREYSPYLVAETSVKADFGEAGNLAFRPLFNYLSGNNRRQEENEMTAPVSQSAERGTGEKIEMTAPMTQAAAPGNTGRYVIGFVMPAKYTRENIPQPSDEHITLRQIPARVMAVLGYSGAWSQERYAEHEKALREEIAKAGWQLRGEIEFARYDPPFMPWFLRRNEVMVEVGPRKTVLN